MKKVLIISILVVSLLSAKQVLVDTNDALSVKVSSNVANIDDNNTNYNSIAENLSNFNGMQSIANFLNAELNQLS